MSMPIEEAIKRIQRHMENHRIGQYPHVYIAEALTMAIDALREKAEREDPKPLTIEELQQMNRQPVFVVPAKPNSSTGAEWCVIWDGVVFIPGYEGWSWNLKDYGKTWIAYRYELPEDQYSTDAILAALELLNQPIMEKKFPSGMYLDKQESGLIEED